MFNKCTKIFWAQQNLAGKCPTCLRACWGARVGFKPICPISSNWASRQQQQRYGLKPSSYSQYILGHNLKRVLVCFYPGDASSDERISGFQILIRSRLKMIWMHQTTVPKQRAYLRPN